jgi:hypothetical protein
LKVSVHRKSIDHIELDAHVILSIVWQNKANCG